MTNTLVGYLITPILMLQQCYIEVSASTKVLGDLLHQCARNTLSVQDGNFVHWVIRSDLDRL